MNLGFRLSFTKVIFFDAGLPKQCLNKSHLTSYVCPRARGAWKARQGRRDKSLEGHNSITLTSRVVQQGDFSELLRLHRGSPGTLPRREQSSGSSHLLLPPPGCFLFPAQNLSLSPLPLCHLFI